MTIDELDRRLHADRPTVLLLAAGAAFLAVYFFLLSTDAQNIAYQLPGGFAAIAVLFGIRRNRPASALPWLLLAFGLALTSIGDWIWVVMDVVMGIEVYPSIADAAYLSGQALIVFAIVLLARGRVPGGDRAGIIDALIVAVGVGLVSWTFLMAPLVADPLSSGLEIGVSLAYPLVDLLLIAVLVRVLLAPGRKVASLRFLVAALVLLLLSDFPYAVMVMEGTYYAGHIVEFGWLAASFMWAAAALHPSMRRVAEPAPAQEVSLPPWRIAILAAASLMGPGVLVLQRVLDQPIDVPVVVIGCVTLFLLVIVRLTGLVDQLRHTLHERHTLERELERRALHDPLTGLPNRTLFYDRLSSTLARSGATAIVFFMDLDDFKTVNDTLGHHAGDALLCQVAESITAQVRPADTVARLGGDEFAVLLQGDLTASGAALIAERVQAAVSGPTNIAGTVRSVGVSIGISMGFGGATTAETLMQEADIAMYVTKSHGKGGHTIFDPRAHGVVSRSMDLQAGLEEGIRRGELELHYQPVIDLASGEIAGVEALVRWRHPARGLLTPIDFIEAAERNGTILPLGRWVIHEAGRQLREWRDDGPTADGRFLGINLSALELTNPATVDVVAEMLADARVDPQQIMIEVTEWVRPDGTAVAASLARLKELGVRIAIDDFGGGFASLTRLLQSTFDVIKIDQSLIQAMHEPRGIALVSGIVDMARRLGTPTIAEGVEDAAQLTELRQLGCELGQGYHFARPMPAAELVAMLRREAAPWTSSPRRAAARRTSPG